MYACLNCGNEFEECKQLYTTYEAMYDAPINSKTYVTIDVCPICEDYCIVEIDLDFGEE